GGAIGDGTCTARTGLDEHRADDRGREYQRLTAGDCENTSCHDYPSSWPVVLCNRLASVPENAGASIKLSAMQSFAQNRLFHLRKMSTRLLRNKLSSQTESK